MKDYRIELRWALIFTLALMAEMYVEKLLGWNGDAISKQPFRHYFIVMPLLYIFIYYIALKEKKKYYYKGKLSWKQGIISGLIISVLTAILSPLAVYFEYHYISPDFFSNMIALYPESATESLEMTQKEAGGIYNMKAMIFQEISTILAFGIVISAIIARVLKTPETEEEA